MGIVITLLVVLGLFISSIINYQNNVKLEESLQKIELEVEAANTENSRLENIIKEIKEENLELNENVIKTNEEKEKLIKEKEQLKKENKSIKEAKARKKQEQIVVKANSKKQKTVNKDKVIASANRSGGTRVRIFTATAYTDNAQSQGKWVGQTATGMKPQVGVVAVDPNVIPLGTKMYIEGYGNAIAGDTGGAIKGNRIDLFMNTQKECINFGRRQVKVTF